MGDIMSLGIVDSMIFNFEKSYDDIKSKRLPFMFNQIFHDDKLKLSGCVPPKTGSTSMNHFWWGTSPYDGSQRGQFDSFQSQGNRFMSSWPTVLKSSQPEMVFLTTRHPLTRLISGWNNILCDKNCRDSSRVTYSRGAWSKIKRYCTKTHHGCPSNWTDDIHMVPFEHLVDILIKEFQVLDKSSSSLDIHFHSYEASCFVCDLPYKYIIKLETFAEDYQFIMRKMGLWDNFDEIHKNVGVKKENESKGLDYLEVLNKLDKETLLKLVELKENEMKMFGYQFINNQFICSDCIL